MQTAPRQQAIAVLGAGSWGTALAIHLAQAGHHITLWAHRPEHAAQLLAAGRNARYLPDAAFPVGLSVQSDLATAVAGINTILVVVPSHALRSVLTILKPCIVPGTRIIWATKGLELGTAC
ncbi:MAG: 2-dehydropantoate 2-reductase N-terminal domain-containing protein, partial [Candidatus Macondimonas sp.]